MTCTRHKRAELLQQIQGLSQSLSPTPTFNPTPFSYPCPAPPSCTSAFSPLHPTPACQHLTFMPTSTSTHPSAVATAEALVLGVLWSKTSPLGPVSSDFWIPQDDLCLIKADQEKSIFQRVQNLAALFLTNPSNQLTCFIEYQDHWGNFQTKHLLQGPLQIQKHQIMPLCWAGASDFHLFILDIQVEILQMCEVKLRLLHVVLALVLVQSCPPLLTPPHP